MKKTMLTMVTGVFVFAMVACQSGEPTPAADTTNVPPHVKDTMAVVRPPITDSSSIVKPMPTNDNNVINIDSAGHTK